MKTIFGFINYRTLFQVENYTRINDSFTRPFLLFFFANYLVEEIFSLKQFTSYYLRRRKKIFVIIILFCVCLLLLWKFTEKRREIFLNCCVYK